MPKPLIGITVDSAASKTTNPYPYFQTRQLYASAIEKAGGIPLLLPWSLTSVTAYADLLDGLVLTGGDDINPKRYGQTSTHPSVTLVMEERTHFEWTMLSAITNRNKPVLGICGGMQLMNVWAGGTLYQDISLGGPYNLHEKGRGRFFSHAIHIDSTSWLYSVIHKKETYVNSFHHQVIQNIAPAFNATAWSEDGCIEAIESKENSSMIGLQWHPEYGDGDNENILKFWIKKTRK